MCGGSGLTAGERFHIGYPFFCLSLPVVSTFLLSFLFMGRKEETGGDRALLFAPPRIEEMLYDRSL